MVENFCGVLVTVKATVQECAAILAIYYFLNILAKFSGDIIVCSTNSSNGSCWSNLPQMARNLELPLDKLRNQNPKKTGTLSSAPSIP